MTDSERRHILTTSARLALEALGAFAGTIVNTKAAMGLSRLTENEISASTGKIVDLVYSASLQGGVG